MTCVQLIPYSDAETDSLYVQGEYHHTRARRNYVIGVGGSSTRDKTSTLGAKLTETFAKQELLVSHFLRRVEDLTVSSLPDKLKDEEQVGG